MVGLNNDRRLHPRADFSGITLVRAGEREIPCIAGNLSETGILLYPQLKRDPGDEFRVTFTLPSLSNWIDVPATLVRTNRVRRRTVWGVRFNDVPGDVREVLRNYVNHRKVSSTAARPSEPQEDIPRPPPVPTPRSQRTTAPMRRTGARSSQQLTARTPKPTPKPTPALVRLAATSTDGPTRMTLRDDPGDVGANDLPTVVTPREETAPPSDDPTRMASSLEAAALRDRCRHN